MLDDFIDLQAVTKIYNQGKFNEVIALNTISLRVAQSEMVCVQGQSGSGKTTLLNIIGCIFAPSSGRAMIAGKKISRLPDHFLTRSAAALFLCGGTVRTAIRILRFWDPEADTKRQIHLENETWLSALLLEYGMALQLISLFILILAADSYAQTLIGAMCATGAFLANDYGIPLLLVKIIGIFLYGFWIVLHRLDIRCEDLPLTRIKFCYALILAPLLLVDLLLLLSYLAQLQPDIITSCCGVVFGSTAGDGKNLIGPVPVRLVMAVFCGLAGLLFACALLLLKKKGPTACLNNKITGLVFSLLWLLFFFVVPAGYYGNHLLVYLSDAFSSLPF